MNINSLPLEIINQPQYQSYAHNVYNCALQNQSNIYTLHGPHSEQENKEKIPHFRGELADSAYYVPSKDLTHIHLFQNNGSVILNGLENNTIVICNKVNHVLIRHCSNLKIYIKKGTISGIDVLKCRHVFVKMPYHNYTNIEHSDNIDLLADMNNTSQLNIIGSLDIRSNGHSLSVNPFTSVIITDHGLFRPTYKEPPILLMCN